MASFFIDIEKLIKEVEKRPGLYHKDAAEYNDKNAKIKLWIEVCEAVIPNWHKMSQHEKNSKGREVKNRWRHLRDSFRKDLKVQKKSLAAGVRPKKRSYIHADLLTFLVPILEEGLEEDHNTSKDGANTFADQDGESRQVENYKFAKYKMNSSMDQDAEGTRSTTDREDGDDQDYEDANQIQECKVEIERLQPQYTNPPKKRKIISYEEDPLDVSRLSRNEDIDEDKFYLLSLLPSFKKLSHRQKVLIKVEILQTLHKVMYQSEQSPVRSTVDNKSFDLNNS